MRGILDIARTPKVHDIDERLRGHIIYTKLTGYRDPGLNVAIWIRSRVLEVNKSGVGHVKVSKRARLMQAI